MTSRRLRPPPDLHELVRKHGGFASVPDAEWKKYIRDVEAWKAALRNDRLVIPPERPKEILAGGSSRCHCGAPGEFYYAGDAAGRFGWYCAAHRPADHFADDRRKQS